MSLSSYNLKMLQKSMFNPSQTAIGCAAIYSRKSASTGLPTNPLLSISLKCSAIFASLVVFAVEALTD